MKSCNFKIYKQRAPIYIGRSNQSDFAVGQDHFCMKHAWRVKKNFNAGPIESAQVMVARSIVDP